MEGNSDPSGGTQLAAGMISKRAPYAALTVFETGPRATWFHRQLTAGGLKPACLDARHAKAARDTAPNETAPTMPAGRLFPAPAGAAREVRIKSSAEGRALISGRAQLASIGIELSNHIRGVISRRHENVWTRRAAAAGGFSRPMSCTSLNELSVTPEHNRERDVAQCRPNLRALKIDRQLRPRRSPRS